MDTMNINKKELLERLQQLQRQQEGLSAEIQDLSGMIQNLPEKVPEQDYLSFKDGEKCWYVEMDGTISNVLYSEKNMKFETIKHRIFKSEHMAKLFAEKTQFLADCLYWKELYDGDYVPDFDSGEHKYKYTVVFDYVADKYHVERFITHDINSVMFSTEEIAQSFADWLNREREEA